MEVRNIDTSGPFGLPTEIRLDLNLKVRNSSSYSVKIEELNYEIDVEGEHFTSNTIYNEIIFSESVSTVPISAEMSTKDVIETIWEYMSHGGFEVQVSGMIKVPFKFFGIVKIFTISKTFQVSCYVERQGISPEAKKATDIFLEQPPSSVREGEVVVFEGRLVEEGTGEGIPSVEIQIADDDGIGDDIMTRGFTDGEGYFSIEWEAESTDWDDVSDVYARFLGTKKYGESDSGERQEVEVV